MRSWIIVCGIALGAVSFTLARGSVPSVAPLANAPQNVTDDTVLYQNLSEIQVKKQAKPSFDQDIERLSKLERRYQERLPNLKDNPRLSAPMKRVSAQAYTPSGAARAKQRTVRN